MINTITVPFWSYTIPDGFCADTFHFSALPISCDPLCLQIALHVSINHHHRNGFYKIINKPTEECLLNHCCVSSHTVGTDPKAGKGRDTNMLSFRKIDSLVNCIFEEQIALYHIMGMIRGRKYS